MPYQADHPIQWPHALERALLILLLRNGPCQLPTNELIRELRDPPDVVEHAIDALVGAGLARREGALVLPTRAAVRFDELGI
jgi:hypothetical protein